MYLGGLRQTFRRLVNSKGFCSSVVLTLSLGIGATVSVFSIIYVVLIKPLPYANPEQLFSVSQSRTPNDEAELTDFSPADFLDFRQQNRAFTDLAAFCGFNYNLTSRGEPKHLNGAAISASLFTILGVQPVLGRNFLPSEDNYSSPHVVLLSYGLWSSEFHGDLQIIGKTISLNGDPYLVVGIMPSNLEPPDGDDHALWVPLQQQIRPDRMLWRDQHFLQVVGRLRPGVTIEQARADLNRIAAQLQAHYPGSETGSGAVILPLQQAMVGEVKTSLLLSLGIVIFVLLIANGNVAILMLARVESRARDLAIRMALGAGTGQLLSDVLSESVILGVIAGILGVFLALAGRRIILHFAPRYDIFSLVQINPAVLCFTLVVSIVSGFAFGLIPATTMARSDVQRWLRSSRKEATERDHLVRNGLLIGQISLSFVLLLGTALLWRSLLSLQSTPLGFRAESVITSWVGLPRIKYQNNLDVVNFFTKLDQKLRNLPGFEAVGLGYPLPLQGNEFWTSLSLGEKTSDADRYESASLRFIDSGYLQVMAVPVLEGRNFTDADDGDAEPVTIVSESFAHKYWPREDALGKYIRIIRDIPVPRRIIGIVGDVKATIEQPPPPTMYVSYQQMSFPSMQMVLLPRGVSASVWTQLQQAVQSVDPNQPVVDVQPMTSIIQRSLEPWRFALALLGGLAGLAVLLTVVGLFAVLSYFVRERTKELGIRMAIGASQSDVKRIVLTQSLKLACFGIILGLLLALVTTRLMRTMVYGINANDPRTFLVVAVLVAGTAILAAYIPAHRAAAIEPLAALHED